MLRSGSSCLTASSMLSTCSVHCPKIPNVAASAVAPMPGDDTMIWSLELQCGNEAQAEQKKTAKIDKNTKTQYTISFSSKALAWDHEEVCDFFFRQKVWGSWCTGWAHRHVCSCCRRRSMDWSSCRLQLDSALRQIFTVKFSGNMYNPVLPDKWDFWKIKLAQHFVVEIDWMPPKLVPFA